MDAETRTGETVMLTGDELRLYRAMPALVAALTAAAAEIDRLYTCSPGTNPVACAARAAIAKATG